MGSSFLSKFTRFLVGVSRRKTSTAAAVCVLGLALRVVMKFTGRGPGLLGAKRVSLGQDDGAGVCRGGQPVML